MTPEPRGRTAPWAKALAAVLLAVLATIGTFYAIGANRANDRKSEAFEETRQDAQRFVHNVLVREGDSPATRQELDEAYAAIIGRNSARLYDVRFDNARTRVVAQFSRSYERFPRLFGPADTSISRCFTIVFPVGSTDPDRAQIIGHGPDESCSEIVAGDTDRSG